MKPKNYFKYLLDLFMGVVFALLFNHRVLGGLAFHEIAGLAIGFAILLHIIFNAKWVSKVTCAIFSKKINARTRIGYLLNLLLLLDLAVIIISGISISRVVFPNVNLQSGFFNKSTHTAASYMGLGLIGIHLGLHWRWVMNGTKQIVKLRSVSKAVGYAARVAAVLIFAFGLYSMASTNYIRNVTQMIELGTAYHEETGQGETGKPDSDEGGSYGGGEVQARAGRGGGGQQLSGRGENFGATVNPVVVVVTYTSIMAVFCVAVYYFEAIWLSTRRKKASIIMV